MCKIDGMLENLISKLSISEKVHAHSIQIGLEKLFDTQIVLVLWYWLNKLHPCSPREALMFEIFPLKGHGVFAELLAYFKGIHIENLKSSTST